MFAPSLRPRTAIGAGLRRGARLAALATAAALIGAVFTVPLAASAVGTGPVEFNLYLDWEGPDAAAGFTGTVDLIPDPADNLATPAAVAISDGVASFTGLDEGSYRVRVNETTSPGGYVFPAQYRGNGPTNSIDYALYWDLLPVGSPGYNANVNNLFIEVQSNAGMSGTVKEADGTPVDLLKVERYKNGEYETTETTDDDGVFSFPYASVDNNYELKFVGTGYAEEWWQDAATQDSSTQIRLDLGEQRVLNAVVAPKPRFEGTVTDASGGPLENVTVGVYKLDGTFVGNTQTDADGNYRLRPPVAGTYKLKFGGTGIHITVWNGGANSAEQAEPIVFDGVTQPANYDAVLVRTFGTISGTLLNEDSGLPVAGANVVAFNADTANANAFGSTSKTDAAGKFTVYTGAGTFKLRFDAPAGSAYLTSYSGNTDSASNATAATVALTTTPDVTLDGRMFEGEFTNAYLPQITGDYKLGETLTADLGIWDPMYTSVTYQWIIVGVPGILGSASTIVVTEAMLGHTIQVAVIGDSEGTQPQGAGGTAYIPDNFDTVGTPTITSNSDGTVLTANAGTWAPTPTNIIYFWIDANTEDIYEQSQTLTITNELRGKTVIAVAIGSLEGFNDDQVSSAEFHIPGYFTTVGVPTITGSPVVGSSLTAHPGTWAPADAEFTYEWTDLASGHTLGYGAVLPVSQSFRGLTATVTVTATAEGYVAASATSVGVYIPKVFTPGTPTITGSLLAGQTLTATPGTWTPASGVTYAYSWTSGGTVLSTTSTLKLTTAMRGKSIAVTVTATAAGYTTATATSTGVVVPNVFSATSAPKISGELLAGKTISVTPGTWSVSGATYSYSWKDAKGAVASTSSKLKLTTVLRGQKLTVTVTAKKSGYLNATSAATVTIPNVLASTATPKIAGKAKVGKTLKATVKAWTPATVKLTYQWKRNGVAISGATKASYKLASKDKSKKITVTVTGKKSGYVTVAKTSAPTAKVKKK